MHRKLFPIVAAIAALGISPACKNPPPAQPPLPSTLESGGGTHTVNSVRPATYWREQRRLEARMESSLVGLATTNLVPEFDDIFKSSDYKVSPFEVESILIEHPAVAALSRCAIGARFEVGVAVAATSASGTSTVRNRPHR